MELEDNTGRVNLILQETGEIIGYVDNINWELESGKGDFHIYPEYVDLIKSKMQVPVISVTSYLKYDTIN